MLRSEAAAWLARLQSGRDEDVERRFRRWRDSDPRNAAAFERVKSSYEQAGLLRQSHLARPSPADAPGPAPRYRPRYAMAAAVALILILPALIIVTRGSRPEAIGAVMLTTDVGQIRNVTLRDGSKVTLDTSSAVEVDIGRSHRRAVVRNGRARFEVVRGSVPFVIDAGPSRIAADQAVVDVERFADQTRVEVLSGRAGLVSGDAADRQVRLGEREGVTVRGFRLSPKEEASTTDWTRGILQFEGTPLRSAVARANAYSGRKILLSDGLDRLRVTGAFRAGDTAGLARALAAAFDLSLDRSRAGGWILSAKAGSGEKQKNGG